MIMSMKVIIVLVFNLTKTTIQSDKESGGDETTGPVYTMRVIRHMRSHESKVLVARAFKISFETFLPVSRN